MNVDLVQIIVTGAIGLIGALGGGSLVYWRATRKQKDAEASKSTTEARLAEANLAEQILEKFQRIVLERMDSGDSVRKQELADLRSSMDTRFDIIENENAKQNGLLADVVEFLNGDFQEFEKKKGTRKSRKS